MLFGQTYAGAEKDKDYWFLVSRKTGRVYLKESMTKDEALTRTEYAQKFLNRHFEWISDVDKFLQEEFSP